jgi:hypothetical protein
MLDLLPLAALLMIVPQGEAASASLQQRETLAIHSVTPSATKTPRFGKLELNIKLSATYDNPFDPEDIDVYALFKPPDGQTLRVNGFLYQEYRRRLEGGREVLEPVSPPVWKVRFAPSRVGRWSWQVFARDRNGSVKSPEARFEVTRSDCAGFVRRSQRSPHHFSLEQEKPLFLVGMNMGWAGDRGTYEYEEWLEKLGRAGGNWIRVWMSSWNCALEWTPAEQGGWRRGTYPGLGRYSLENAWKLDTILDLAGKNGIYVMLCFGTYGEFTTGGFFNEGQWKENPYNRANGGPCEKPEDFWTNAEARKLYQRRLRYIAARYGYSTFIHSWEFWNEVPPQPQWTAEMARFLKGTGEFAGQPADPHGHLVSTSYGNGALWRIPEIDFTMSHHYGTGNIPDHAPIIHLDARGHKPFEKPHLMAEFGIDYRKSDLEYDRDGRAVNFHNGLWASMASGNAGSGMLWWWDNYVHPKNLYPTFTGLRRFSDRVRWTEGKWSSLQFDAPVSDAPDSARSDLYLVATTGWGRAETERYVITPRGIANDTPLFQFLYSPAKADLRTTPELEVNFEQPGRFILHVDRVSSFIHLRILLNGVPVRDLRLSARPPSDPSVKPEYAETQFMQEYNDYQARFDRDYSLDVPAGRHTIKLEALEGDWVSIKGITLTGYTSARNPAMNLYGITTGTTAALWLQNAQHNWKNVFEGKPIPVLKGVRTVVRGMKDGKYTLEWWDTRTGAPLSRQSVEVKEGAFTLSCPDIASDIAAIIRKQVGGEDTHIRSQGGSR